MSTKIVRCSYDYSANPAVEWRVQPSVWAFGIWQQRQRSRCDTVARFERGEELKERTIEALQRALEAAGVEFTNGEQPGVRLNKSAAAHHVKTAIKSTSAKAAGRRSAKGEAIRGRRQRW